MSWLIAALAVVALLAMLWGVLARADRPAASAPSAPPSGPAVGPGPAGPLTPPSNPQPAGAVVPYPSFGAPAWAEEAPAQFQPFAGARLSWDQLYAFNVLNTRVL